MDAAREAANAMQLVCAWDVHMTQFDVELMVWVRFPCNLLFSFPAHS